jgi:hypothetical protein
MFDPVNARFVHACGPFRDDDECDPEYDDCDDIDVTDEE